MPVAEIRILLPQKDESILGMFLIDSGATSSLLPAVDAHALGISIETGRKVLVSGVTGRQITGYRHEVAMDISGYIFERVPVLFTKNRDAPRVPGRESIFPRFGIFFDESKKRIAFLEAESERSRIDEFFN